jgi:hypothetical protein
MLVYLFESFHIVVWCDFEDRSVEVCCVIDEINVCGVVGIELEWVGGSFG